MKTFKSIKIASDLSKNAKTAYDFAQKLGEELHATLSLVHVYMQPNSPNSTSLLGFMPSLKEIEEEALKKLKHFAHNPDVNLEVYPGSATDALLALSAETDLLVMGTHGEQGLIDKVFGSVSLSVSRNADCPVLIVPKKAKYKGIKQILFATDESSVDVKHLDRIADFAKKMGAKIHFVHVSEGGNDFDLKKIDVLMQPYAHELPYEAVNLDFISVRGAFDYYREHHKIDLIVMATHHFTLWERLFHHSLTEQVEWNTDLPVLVLHDEDK